MRLSLRRSILLLAGLFASTVALGQTSATPPAHKPVPWKRYCQPDGGFCFQYPASWEILTETLAGQGVVIAPAQKSERAQWDEITVAHGCASARGR